MIMEPANQRTQIEIGDRTLDACDFLSDNGGEYWELLRELWQVEELVDGYGCTANAGDLADRAEYLRELLERY